MNRWDPDQYLKFADLRFRAAVELLERVPLQSPTTIADLGCGTGEITQLITNHWPSAVVTGIDAAEEMSSVAQANAPQVRWEHISIDRWAPRSSFDLIYSNSALHWLPDHDKLFRRLAGYLNPGGCLAVQMPLSWESPAHVLMRETLANCGPHGKPVGTTRLREALQRKPVADAKWYYHLLAGFSNTLDIWETEYLHVLNGQDAVLEWLRGAALRPILNDLADDQHDVFMSTYRDRLKEQYPPSVDGDTLFPFRRLFIVASM